ncbi:hypothetical protein [Paenibacillus shenyangensis]|uniref:hypothetical protein n=1 Tax=Paenibacillus sp. A9 TaxID=1284352 RepID=UPI00036C519C|nr:hypothetical protein [Paenibacillus sp. A9]
MLHRYTDTHLLLYYNDSLLMISARPQGYESYDELSEYTQVFMVSGPEELESFDPAGDHSDNHDPHGQYVIDYGYHDHLLEQINGLLRPEREQRTIPYTVANHHLMNTLVKNYTRVVYTEGPISTANADITEMILLPEDELPAEMTALAQYFTAHGMWLGALSRLQIQAGSPKTQHMLRTEVLPHFENKKQSASNGDIQTFYMYRLRAQSRELFERTHTGALSIIHDLYRHHDTEEWFRPGVQDTEEYLIHTEHLESDMDSELDHLREWIKDSYLAYGQHYLVMPLGWMLDDSLLHSVALRFFAGIAPAIRLRVESGTGRIILIELCADEPAHSVYFVGESR